LSAWVKEHAHANGNSSLIHHVKHLAKPLANLTDEPANRSWGSDRLERAFTEIQGAIGESAITHFVIQARDFDVVQGSIREHLRNYEQ